MDEAPDSVVYEVSRKDRWKERVLRNEKKAVFIAGLAALFLVVLAAILVSGVFVWLSKDNNNTLHSQYYSSTREITTFTREHAEEYFEKLTLFTDLYPARICGSASLEDGVLWMKEMWENESQFDSVLLQPVDDIPNWIRNEASLTLLEPRVEKLPLLALGNSISTPLNGIEGEVIVVKNFDELEQRKHDVSGKIVLYNCLFTTYGETVVYRVRGAIEAAKHGAVASLVRSITPFSLQTPHTGVMRYDDDVTKIPHAAITLEYADYFQVY